MIVCIYWADATSDIYPAAWCNFNHSDLDGAAAWIAEQRRNYRHGMARAVRRNQIIMQEVW